MRHASSHSIFPPHITRSRSHAGRFGRLFGQGFTAWEPPGNSDEEKEAAIAAHARTMFATGPDDDDIATDDLAADVDARKERIPVGYTYFGQFIDHDITFDPQSSLTRKNDPNGLQNFRSPRFDLDSVYGGGPDDQPFLYDKSREDDDGFSGFLRTGLGADRPGEREEDPPIPSTELDLQRNDEGTAIIGDPRNDENVIVSQLQLAFCLMHNNILDLLIEEDVLTANAAAQTEGDAIGADADTIAASAKSKRKGQRELFDEAQRLTTWFYQYVVWNDFVARITDPKVFHAAIKLPATEDGLGQVEYGLKHVYDWTENPFIPVEFSVAAYRFGHSMIRGGYLMNFLLGTDREDRSMFLPIFDLNGVDDLRGGHRLRPRHTVQWDWYFQFKSSFRTFPQLARKIDTRLSSAVFAIPAGKKTNPLAELNIRRGWRMQLPPASEVARALNVPPMVPEGPFDESLWVYILKEAETKGKGLHLGPVGSSIVAAVFSGLLRGDAFSYISRDPAWTPDAEMTNGKKFFETLFQVVGRKTGKDGIRLEKASEEGITSKNPRRWEMVDIIRASGLPENGPDIRLTVPPRQQQQPAPPASSPDAQEAPSAGEF